MKKLFLLFLMTLLPMIASAYDAWVDGIYYYFNQTDKIATVTYRAYDSSGNKNAYSGSVSIPSTVDYNGETYSVTSIGHHAFMYCNNLTSVDIPSSVTSIEGYVFMGCNNLIYVDIPNSVTSIGEYVFSGCSNLTSINIPDGVMSIGVDAFGGTGWYNNQPDGVLYLDNWLIGYKGEETTGIITIAEGTKGIADAAFDGCNGLVSITIPNSVTILGKSAFSWCSNLISINIPNSVTTIGDKTFASCSSLTSVALPNSITTIGFQAFYCCESMTSFTIPNSVTSIGNEAFNYCTALTSLTISNNLTSIGDKTFANCSSLTSVIIPNSVTIIGMNAFEGCSGLTSVDISNSVTNIDNYAFSGCSGLTSIIIPNSVTRLGDDAFKGCSSLSSVTLPNNLTSIEHGTFWGCNALKTVKIPNEVTSIGVQAFQDCWSLELLDIPNGVTYIGGYAFYNCHSLKSLVIPNNVTSIENYTFHYCSGLTSFVIPSSITKIGEYAFYECNNLTSITIPNSVSSIGESAFENCRKMETLKLPDKLQIIKKMTFKGCNSLKSVTIPSTVEFIYQEAFANCAALESVKAKPGTPPFLYDNSFSNYSVPLEVPKGCKQDYQTAQGWKNFTNISESDKGYYKLIYLVDNEEYKSYKIEDGTPITPEATPNKEGYTFSGWSEIPETMPAYDVTVTGSFTINKYKLTYMVDDVEYKSYELDYGTTITPEPAPTKEGYTFSGWSTIPATMPAKDVTVTGTFTINKYKLTYMVDGAVYKTYEIEYGKAITPEPAPTKETYVFSGWSEIPETMPEHDVIVTGTFERHFDVGHVVNVVNFIMNANATPEDIALYDMNNDNELNIGDIILVLKSILNSGGGGSNLARSRTENSVDLAQYTAAQFILSVADGTSVKDIHLVKSMEDSHQIMYSKKGANTYYVVVYSLSNQLMKPENGNIIVVETDGGNNTSFTMRDMIVALQNGETERYQGHYGGMTGIREFENEATPTIIYDLKGNRIEGSHGLKNGLYIINGKKVVVK